MSSKADSTDGRTCWFVGSCFNSTEDQTERFVREGIWENGYQDKYLEMVRSVQVGDRIAIKSTYTRKHGLPFDNRGLAVSVMAIKAIGTVTGNVGDGRQLKVDWILQQPFREWFFYTNRMTIWRVIPGEWYADTLIEFAFENRTQDIKRFRNAPFWRERFGDTTIGRERFAWTRFYIAMADKLLEFRNRRKELVDGLHAIGKKVDCLSILNDQYEEGVMGGPLKDICPFTAFGAFNRGITELNRKHVATELSKFLGVSEKVPDSFEGIPLLNNQNTWFFGYSFRRKPDDIDNLWEVFAQALAFSESDDPDSRAAFLAAYDRTVSQWGIGWNLTMGLFWARPWTFPTLDSQSQRYIKEKLNIQIGLNGPKGRCSAEDYLSIRDTLEARFQEDAYPDHSFPELSLNAWNFNGKRTISLAENTGEMDLEFENHYENVGLVSPIESYSLENIVADGCFLQREKLQKILERLRTKRNLILQGPPGTGKTFLARRLAFALMGQRDESKVRAVQFHPNLSYEDFIRGWRPEGSGKLALVDGPFLEMVNTAVKDPQSKYVVVIEEVNRGNPAQIFGEMLTLLDVDKRTPNEALELCYRRVEGERVFIPGNFYVIGTMNIADRSLALVDLALRRRFAFVDLEPTLGIAWREWINAKCGISLEFSAEIEHRLSILNKAIASSANLGPQFRIGHSYVTPPSGVAIENEHKWFRDVVETEIGPLLSEYYFDSPTEAQQAQERLLQGL